MSVLDDLAPPMEPAAGLVAPSPPEPHAAAAERAPDPLPAVASEPASLEQVAEVRAHVQRLEEAVLTLAGAIGRQRVQLTSDVDDIIAHQGLAIRRQLDEVLERLAPPAPAPEPAPTTRHERRTARRQAKAAAKVSRRAAKARRRGRRGQLLVPSLFLAVGMAGGFAVGASPYEAGGDRCEGPFRDAMDQAVGSGWAPPTSDACIRAASDRMLLATVPALGGVMAAVAVVVMSDGGRSVRAARLQPASR